MVGCFKDYLGKKNCVVAMVENEKLVVEMKIDIQFSFSILFHFILAFIEMRVKLEFYKSHISCKKTT